MRGITYDIANNLIKRAISVARKQGLPPLAIVVLDSGGHVKACGCEDGVGTLRFEIAQGKANAALGMGFDTRQFSELLARGVLSEAFSASLSVAANGKCNPNAGGVLLIPGAEIIGAIGISGASAEQDDFVARSAMAVV